MGWFFGFKLHLIINNKGEILNFMFTTGNVDDREPLKDGVLLKNIKGKLFGDKGYIGKALFENLFIDGVQLITKVKNNMKNIAQIEHSRHRLFNNFIVNALGAIAAYCFFEKKPAIELEFVNDGQLLMF